MNDDGVLEYASDDGGRSLSFRSTPRTTAVAPYPTGVRLGRRWSLPILQVECVSDYYCVYWVYAHKLPRGVLVSSIYLVRPWALPDDQSTFVQVRDRTRPVRTRSYSAGTAGAFKIIMNIKKMVPCIPTIRYFLGTGSESVDTIDNVK